MAQRHIVKSYDRELDLLRSKISEMGRESQDQISKAVEALVKRESGLADVVIVSDEKVDLLQHETEEHVVRMLATRQPMANDLRHTISGLKIASELERIADYAANIAKHVSDLDYQLDLEKPIESIIRMAYVAEGMLADIIDAYWNCDVQKAVEVWHRDDEIDRIYAHLLNQLNQRMSQDSENIKAYTGLVFIARCCERIGDHITNVAENVYFIENGTTYIGGEVALM